MDRNWRTPDSTPERGTSRGALKSEFSVGEHEHVRMVDRGFECADCSTTAVLLREMDGEPCGDSDE